MSESLQDKLDKVRTAAGEKFSTKDNYAWCQDVLDDGIIIQIDGEVWKIGYTIADDGTVTFAVRADWEKVVGKEYVTVKASDIVKQYEWAGNNLKIFRTSEPTGPLIDMMERQKYSKTTE